MANSESCIHREEFCKVLTEKLGTESDLSVTIKSVEDIYDLVFDSLASIIQENPEARVYLPKIGVVYTSDIPANPKQGLPPRRRYRLSCKAFPR